MLLWKKLIISMWLVAALAGCDALHEQTPGSLNVRDARLVAAADGMRLDVDLDCRFNGPISDALEHGIPITLDLHLQASGENGNVHDRRQIELRYFPLTRRYQLRDTGSELMRSYAASGYLADALSSLRLPLSASFDGLPAGTRLKLDVELDHSALPGALRLPAMVTSG